MTNLDTEDFKLVRLAARAVGREWVEVPERIDSGSPSLWLMGKDGSLGATAWNPLQNDADAFRLAIDLAIPTAPSNRSDYAQSAGNATSHSGDKYAQMRRAITMSAAYIAANKGRLQHA